MLHPQGLELAQVYDETEYIHSSIDLVSDNICRRQPAHVRHAAGVPAQRPLDADHLPLIPSARRAVPGDGADGPLAERAQPGGLAFAVGMLVDNAIVMLENIYRHYQVGEDPLEASVNGTSEVWGALLNATLANLAVFIPVLFVQDEAGQLFRDIALAISAAVALSLLVALIVVPTAARRIIEPQARRERAARAQRQRPHGLAMAHGSSGRRLHALGRRHFGRKLMLAVRRLRPRRSSTAVVGINRWLQEGVLRRLVVIVRADRRVARRELPAAAQGRVPAHGNRNLVIGILLPPPGYNLDQLSDMGETIETRPASRTGTSIPDRPKAETLDVSADRRLLLRRPQPAAVPGRARGRSDAGRRAGGPGARGRLPKLPGTIVDRQADEPVRAGPDRRPHGRRRDHRPGHRAAGRLGGADAWARCHAEDPPDAQALPGAQPRPVATRRCTSFPSGSRRPTCRVTAADLGYTVDALVDGAYATDYYLGGDKIDLTIIGKREVRQPHAGPGAAPIATPTGQLVPLEAVADVNYRSGPEQINHRERQRAITIQVTPPVDMPLEAGDGH